MYDVHNHYFWGLDDGPRDLELSQAMIDAAVAAGITHVVCTPHANEHWTYQPEVNRERLAELQAYAGDRLTLGVGCDFHLTYDNIEDEIEHPGKHTINGKRYLLVEFPDYGIPPTIGETLYNFVASGTIPIITHPERNATLSAKPEMMAEWLRSGCIVQVTASSLLERFGKRAQAVAHELLKKNWVHLLASDAHNISSRPPNLPEAHQVVAEEYGIETADRLCIHTPKAIFYGEELPEQPEMFGPLEDLDRKKTGLLARLFS